MNSDPPANSNAQVPFQGFKNYNEAFKELQVLSPPISEQARKDYLERLRVCPSARYVAFRLLALRAVGDMPGKLLPFIPELETILHQDAAPLDLRNCESVDAVRQAIFERLRTIKTTSDIKRLAGERSHLPVLLEILRMWADAPRFQAGLDSLSTALDRTSAKRPKVRDPSNNLEVLVRVLVAHVPEKPMLGKTLPELLKISTALFRQTEETSRENLRFESELVDASRQINSLQSALANEVAARTESKAESDILRATIERMQAELQEEKEHFEILKHHSDEDRKKSVRDAVARVRSEVLRRLENIRLYADRELPNRKGILDLITEIDDALNDEGLV